AYLLHLFSKEFLLGLFLWGISVGIILLQIITRISMPSFLLTGIKVFSVFAGCCWVAFPLFMYLEMKMHRQLRKTLKPGRTFPFVTGIDLWQQAVRGRLPVQFFGAIVLEAWLVFVALGWPLSASWRVLLLLALWINAMFFVVFPLLLIVGVWVKRGVRSVCCQRRRQLTNYHRA
ncbi:MAG TPA: hypothetical protein VFN35_33920, partial [Ktedonobacteraceae bacterium]|nr:hypothetical protein [Ktedonobacteraceae bacterium]